MKRCKIPVGCKLADKPCCADCEVWACEARCWNSPKRCGCWEERPPTRKREGHPQPRKVDDLKTALLYCRGMSRKEIARQLGCSVTTVSRALQRLGV
ncbi:MAG: helix-turn-helix domain-containing protein [Oscillospiraceae bacterium]|nr:helix-turn-helix domain-containing protein [Oscillospiraceae bacterium]